MEGNERVMDLLEELDSLLTAQRDVEMELMVVCGSLLHPKLARTTYTHIFNKPLTRQLFCQILNQRFLFLLLTSCSNLSR